MDDGTEAIDGAPAQVPPAAPPVSAAPDTNPGTPTQPAAATPPPMTQSAQQVAAQMAAAPPPVQKRGGLAGMLESFLDILDPPQQSGTYIDGNGVKQQRVMPSKSIGQQLASVATTALSGAATAASAPPGPGHTMQGVAAAVEGGLAKPGQQQAQRDEAAEHSFQVEQKAKADNLNYQIGTRKLMADNFALTRMKVKGDQEDVNFAQQQEDREGKLGSIDLGTFQGATDIHNIQTQNPDVFKHLGKGLLMPLPVFDAAGNRVGTKVYLRTKDANSQIAPDGTQVPVFSPGDKSNPAPHYNYITPTTPMTQGDVQRYELNAASQKASFLKGQADLNHTNAETKELGARTVEAIASAGRANAETRKTNIEAANTASSAGIDNGEGGNSTEQNAEMMVEGLSSPSLMSKRGKNYNAMLPAANAYSLKKYGVPFDAEVSEGRYKARAKTLENFTGIGPAATQITSLNTFFGHAGALASEADKLRTTNSPLLNVPLKELRKQMGDARYDQIEPLIYAVRKEYQNFLSNNRALHNDDISEGAEMMNDNMSLAQMEGALKGFGGAALTRSGQLNNQFKRNVKIGDIPDMIDPGTKQAIQKIGLHGVATRELGTAYTGRPQQQGQPPQAATPQQAGPVQPPAGAQAEVHDSTGKLIGHAVNGKYVPLGQP